MNLLHLSTALSAVLILTAPLRGQVFTPIADQNTPVPGGATGETFTTFNKEGVPWVSNRCIVFRGEGSAGTEGLYLVRSGVIEGVADVNTPVPGGDGQEFLEFEESFALDGCDVVFDGIGDDKKDARRGIYLKREGMPLEVVVDDTTTAPAGGTFFDFENPWLESDVIVFIAETTGGGCTSRSIYKATDGGFMMVVDGCGGTPVPGGLPGETFTPLETLPIVESEVLTFTAEGDMATHGVYVEVEGTLESIADSATPIPDGDGALFSQFIEYVPTSGGELVFGGAGPEETAPFTYGGLYQPAPGGIETVIDLVDPPLPGWDPGDPVIEFAFWFCGDVITLGAVGITSPEAIFLLQGDAISRLVTAGDSLDGKEIIALSRFAHCSSGRILFVAEFRDGPVLYLVTLPLFEDSFESGDTSAWSSTVL